MKPSEQFLETLEKSRKHNLREGHLLLAKLQHKAETLQQMIETETNNNDTDPEANGDRIFFHTLADLQYQLVDTRSEQKKIREMMRRLASS